MMLKDKVAVVTGAARGIGREIALLLAKHGAKVVVNDYGGGSDGAGDARGPADDVVNEIKGQGGQAAASYDSVASMAGGQRIVQTALDHFGHVDIVVNNAGILRDRMIFNMSEDDWDSVIAVHLKGTFNCTRHACVYWREQHKAGNVLNGRIINTASDSGLLGNPSQSNYGAAKAAIAAFSIIIDREMAKYGVSVNCIAPVARTRLTVDATPATAALMGQQVAEGEFDVFSPHNIAPLVAWLASDDAADAHGEVFRVGGGTVWAMQGWHSVGKVQQHAVWDPQELGTKLKAELAKGGTRKETMADVFAGGL